MTEFVILVDENDNAIGVEEKLKAHREGKLHRAFSVFIFNSNGEMLLQRRALNKYHSGGLWTNACCSHPRPDESVLEASSRRLQEEMGFGCALTRAFDFIYRAELEGGLVEHEFDHIMIGQYDGEVNPNPTEVIEYRWQNTDSLQAEVEKEPQHYTTWFKIALTEVIQKFAAIRGH